MGPRSSQQGWTAVQGPQARLGDRSGGRTQTLGPSLLVFEGRGKAVLLDCSWSGIVLHFLEARSPKSRQRERHAHVAGWRGSLDEEAQPT